VVGNVYMNIITFTSIVYVQVRLKQTKHGMEPFQQGKRRYSL